MRVKKNCQEKQGSEMLKLKSDSPNEDAENLCRELKSFMWSCRITSKTGNYALVIGASKGESEKRLREAVLKNKDKITCHKAFDLLPASVSEHADLTLIFEKP